jgi:hypothetical protein
MKYDVLALLAFCVVGFGGLGYLFVSITDGINEPIGTKVVQTSELDGLNAPPAGPIVDESAPIVLGSSSITTTEAHNVIMVNFNECAPGSGSLDLESGFVSFEIQGQDGNNCAVSYAAGEDAASCSVPRSLGLQRFTISNGVPNVGAIERYCEAQ